MALAPNTGYGMLNPGTTNSAYPGTNNPNTPTAPASPAPPGGSSPFSGQITPDAGIYGSESAAALAAYQAAQASLLAQRNSLYNQYGFTNDGLVDPKNPYGQYQQLLGGEATQLQADQADAAGRGLGRGGLANRQSGIDQRGDNAQNWQFQRQVGDVATQYKLGGQQAQAAYQQALAQAYNDAIQAALQQMLANMGNGGGGGGGGGDSSSQSDGSSQSQSVQTNYFRPTSMFSGSKSRANADVRVKGGRI